MAVRAVSQLLECIAELRTCALKLRAGQAGFEKSVFQARWRFKKRARIPHMSATQLSSIGGVAERESH